MESMNRLPTVLCALALTVSLTGAGAYAATQISGSTIKNGTIAASKLTPRAISQLRGAKGLTGPPGATGPTGAEGDAGAAGTRGPAGPTGPARTPGAPGAPGAQGPVGPAGANSTAPGPQGAPGGTGPAGPPGTAGVSGYVIVTANGTGTAEAACPAGDRVLGGGGSVANNGALTFTLPNGAGTAWTATAANPGVAVVAYAVCAAVD
jgi:hypothetical protein